MQIEITEKALQDLENLDNYLLARWNNKVLLDFYKKLETILDNIQSGFIIYQNTEDKRYSKVLITKHNTLIYNKSEEKITIIRVINNFQSDENKRY
jgi:plasmid stabilization system protein ParE